MAFCTKCGKEMGEDAKFCPSCGAAVGGTAPGGTAADGTAPASRTVETVGTLRKNCPSCGQPIESFQTRCPSCGHELNQAQVSGVFQAFLDELNEASAPKEKEEGASARYHREQILVENYILPNTREDLLEFLIFAASKQETGIGRHQWNRMCKQIYAKARLCLKSDPATLKIIKDILAENHIS